MRRSPPGSSSCSTSDRGFSSPSSSITCTSGPARRWAGSAVSDAAGQALRGDRAAHHLRRRRRHRGRRGRVGRDRRLPQEPRQVHASSVARIPKGVLLSGQPGTGKTLLARAVAGEANVPFFSMSASEFIEMVVGVGASRVRDLFNQAKKVAPAIIFIDELDAIGRARGGRHVAGRPRRARADPQPDPHRDGRLHRGRGRDRDRRHQPPRDPRLGPAPAGPVRPPGAGEPPDQAGRGQILEVHTRNVPLDADVDLNAIASTTPGMVGADLQNLVNEAALMAARRDHDKVMLPATSPTPSRRSCSGPSAGS
jgi:hypothetical protein